jgi:hypothetical protein
MRSPGRCRSADDRGASLVEAALVMPLLFALIFGILEIGGALKSYSSTGNAVRAGGRMASVAGNDAMADQQILERVAEEAAGLGKGEVEYVIIWRADGEGDTAPAACVTLAGASDTPNSSSVGVFDGGPGGTATGACNVYREPDKPGGAFAMARGDMPNPPDFYFGCSGPPNPNKVDCSWSPRNRNVQISPRSAAPSERLRPDYIGVHIRASHQYYTGFLGDTLTITDNGVNLLEPDTYGLDTP